MGITAAMPDANFSNMEAGGWDTGRECNRVQCVKGHLLRNMVF